MSLYGFALLALSTLLLYVAVILFATGSLIIGTVSLFGGALAGVAAINELARSFP